MEIPNSEGFHQNYFKFSEYTDRYEYQMWKISLCKYELNIHTKHTTIVRT